MANNAQGPAAVSPELDNLSCDLIESALDTIAEGGSLGVIAAYETKDGKRDTQVFEEDSPELCIRAAKDFIRSHKQAVRYGIVYDGAVAPEEDGAFLDAVILEFGEAGAKSAFSGYVLYENAGDADNFAWTDPQPAGEVELLVRGTK